MCILDSECNTNCCTQDFCNSWYKCHYGTIILASILTAFLLIFGILIFIIIIRRCRYQRINAALRNDIETIQLMQDILADIPPEIQKHPPQKLGLMPD